MQKVEGYKAGHVEIAHMQVPQYQAPFKPVSIPDRPDIYTQLNSEAEKPQLVIIANSNNDVGQDLMDRSIAHAVTGGYFPGVR